MRKISELTFLIYHSYLKFINYKARFPKKENFLERIMLENILQKQKQKTSQHVKCVKCHTREATNEDQMCDSCRYMLTLENIIKNRK